MNLTAEVGLGYAKLGWHVHKLLGSKILADSENVDVVYGPGDRITPCIFNIGDTRKINLIVTVKALDVTKTDQRQFLGVQVNGGCESTELSYFRPKLPPNGYCIIE